MQPERMDEWNIKGAKNSGGGSENLANFSIFSPSSSVRCLLASHKSCKVSEKRTFPPQFD